MQHITKLMISVFDRIENVVGKGVNAGITSICFFSHKVSKDFSHKVSKDFLVKVIKTQDFVEKV